MYGRSGLRGKRSWLRALTPVFAGRITRSSHTTVAGTASTPITTLIGTIPFMTVWAILAGMIRNSLVTISSTARTRLAQRSATMAALIRLEWRPVQDGSVAVTWTRAMAHRRGTSSAWNFSLRLIHSTARPTKATRPRHPILQLTPGVARLRRVALSATSCKPLLKRKKLLVSKW
jgi:hypothetical protein